MNVVRRNSVHTEFNTSNSAYYQMMFYDLSRIFYGNEQMNEVLYSNFNFLATGFLKFSASDNAGTFNVASKEG